VRLGPALQQPDGQVRLFGAIPPKDAMVVMSAYRYGGGQVGNVAENTINVLKTALPYIERVRNLVTALGGTDAESLEYAKMRVPGYLRTLRRAVTASDFEYLSQEAAPGEIGRVYCLQPPLTNRGEIKILLIPRVPRLGGFIPPESLNLTEQLQENVRQFLDERRLLSTRLEVSAPAYQWVETEVRLHVTDTYNPDKVRRDVEERLFNFLNPLIGGFDGKGWPFGRDLFVADVMSSLLAVPGVNFVRSVTLYPITYNEGQFTRGVATQEVPIASHGVVVSYQHNIVTI
jgi:predicted phage baseplate assembly protein